MENSFKKIETENKTELPNKSKGELSIYNLQYISKTVDVWNVIAINVTLAKADKLQKLSITSHNINMLLSNISDI